MKLGGSLSLLLAVATAPFTSSQSDIVSVHGSGTTNPSKCYWHIMDQLHVQSKNNIRLTYRAVGSSTGQKEFIGADGSAPDNHFGSGDVPLSSDQFNSLTLAAPAGAGVGVVQLPVVMGSVSFFHSVPIGAEELKLTPCLLARIFRREITDWNHAEIKDLNPGWEFATSFPITVARRVHGSSSTSGVTNFLRMACPAHWPEDMVGKELDNWDPSTKGCEGSGGVTTCIREELGTIGYIDSGHGHAEGLSEVSLQNKFGTFLTSKTAAEEGGVVAAATAEGSGIPDSVDQDFSATQLLNQDGKFTWPIVAISYLYVRKDLPSFLPDPAAQTLLIAFIQALYRDDYITECEEEFGFVRVSGAIYDKAMDGISMLQTSEGAPTWTFENETDARVGQADYVFSVKRQSYSEVEQDRVVDMVGKLQALIDDLKAQNIVLQSAVSTLEEKQAQQGQMLEQRSDEEDITIDAASPLQFGAEEVLDFTESDATQLKAAVVLSSMSFAISIIGFIFLLLKFRCGV